METHRDKVINTFVEAEQSHFRKRKQSDTDRAQFVARLWESIKDQLIRERAVWGPAKLHPLEKWQLDATEGPYRMRKKMERNKDFYIRYSFKSIYKKTCY